MSLLVVSDVRWLNDQENHLITIDSDILSLHEITQKSNFTFDSSLICSSALLSVPVRQDHVCVLIF